MRGEEYLTKPQQYNQVYSNGSSWVSGLVVMKALANDLGLSRCGFSVSKQVGKAVTRNRVKRRFREIVRVLPLKAGWDIVFVARPAAANAAFISLRGAIEGLLSRAGLLEAEGEDRLPLEVKAGEIES